MSFEIWNLNKNTNTINFKKKKKLKYYLFGLNQRFRGMGQSYPQTDIATIRLNQPRGPFSENYQTAQISKKN